jgi:hypothetical protein
MNTHKIVKERQEDERTEHLSSTLKCQILAPRLLGRKGTRKKSQKAAGEANIAHLLIIGTNTKMSSRRLHLR